MGAVAVERGSSIKFLGVHISDNLSWTQHITAILKGSSPTLLPQRFVKIRHITKRSINHLHLLTSKLTDCTTALFRTLPSPSRKLTFPLRKGSAGTLPQGSLCIGSTPPWPHTVCVATMRNVVQEPEKLYLQGQEQLHPINYQVLGTPCTTQSQP